MAKADILAGRAYVSLYAKNDISKALKTAQKDLQTFGSSIVGLGAKVVGMGAAITGGITAAVVNFSNVGDALGKMSARTGVAASALSELGFAAEQSGGTIENVESSLQRMAKNLGGVGPESIKTKEALHAMGMSVEAIQGMNPEQQFEAIAQGIANIQDPTQKAAAAMAVFGNSGRQLLPMLGDIKALRQEAKELGLSPSPESIKAAEEINDAINRVRRVIGAAFFEIGSALAPLAMEVLTGMLSVVKAIKKFVVENKALVITAAKVGAVLSVAGTAIVAVGTAFIFAGSAIGGIVSLIGVFTGAMAAVASIGGLVVAAIGSILSPVGLLTAALIGGVIAWVKFTTAGQETVTGLRDIFSDVFGGMATTVTDSMGAIFNAIRAGDLALAGQIAMVGLQLVFVQALESIHKLFGDTIGTIVAQIVNGDLEGAWTTTTAALTVTWDAFATNITERFQEAADAIMDIWRTTAGFLNDNILDYLSAATGKDVRLGGMKLGKKSLGDPVGAADPPGVPEKSPAVQQAEQIIENATKGQAAIASEAVKALQAELAALQKQAANKVEEMKATSEGTGTSGGGRFGGSVGKASAASFNLGALAQMTGRGSFESKQLAATEKGVKLQQEAVNLSMQTLLEMQGWSFHHP
jgi:TP901 family phage tail tape measure protein